MHRTRSIVTGSFLALFITAAAAAAPVEPDPRTKRASGETSPHRPVIYVHGLYADDFDLWSLSRTYLLAHGYGSGDITDFHYVSLNGAQPAADQLAAEVDWLIARTGKPQVDIVSHSLGSLVTKVCVVEGGCKGKVARWVNLAGANNGTGVELPPAGPTIADLAPDGPLIARLNEAHAREIEAQGIAVQVQWSPGDTSILPPELSKEPYAENVELPATVTHQSVLWDPEVIARTFAFLSRE